MPSAGSWRTARKCLPPEFDVLKYTYLPLPDTTLVRYRKCSGSSKEIQMDLWHRQNGSTFFGRLVFNFVRLGMEMAQSCVNTVNLLLSASTQFKSTNLVT